MKLTTELVDNKHHIDLWLTLFQGGVGYTKREKEVLAEFISVYFSLKSRGLIEPYLSKEVFGTSVRLSVRESLEMSAFNLTNILAALKNKGCIIDDKINTQLLPEKELLFEFK